MNTKSGKPHGGTIDLGFAVKMSHFTLAHGVMITGQVPHRISLKAKLMFSPLRPPAYKSKDFEVGWRSETGLILCDHFESFAYSAVYIIAITCQLAN